jgi:hypothetical protein
LLPLAVLLAAATAPQTQTQTAPVPDLPDDQAAFRAHVMFLASDAMKGREAGTPEYDIAAQYVAAQFYAAGLKPAGERGDYLQSVPLIGYKPADRGDFVLTTPGGASTPLVFGTDYVPAGNPADAQTGRLGQVVFVGQGVVAPRWKQDDYKGVSVKGRIVAFTGGATSVGDPEERAHFARVETKAALAASRGAIGYMEVQPGEFAGTARRYDRQRVTWAGPNGFAPADGAAPLGTLSAAGADKLFGAGWAQLKRPVLSRGTLAVATRTAFEKLPSSNVVGLLPGGDPKLKQEYVVLSAHLDHIGICPEVAGDTICNGAEDNATGIASLIEEAKRFKASGKAPRRSILFLAVTAEEKGLIGADYFANHPTVPKSAIVADVNLDMPLLTYPFEDMTVYGAERSTLGPIVAAAAGSVGVGMSPDPAPEMGLFVRSDHYRFVQQGIPSVFLWPGQKGPGKAAWAEFFAKRYHRPSDDLSQPIDWAQAMRFVDANYRIARAIADNDARPVWNRGDFFGTLYRGPMAR